MKKIILSIFSVISVLLLGACSDSEHWATASSCTFSQPIPSL